MSPGPVKSPRLPADQLEQLRRLRTHQARIAPALDVEADQGLRVGRAEIEAPGLVFQAQAIGQVLSERAGAVASKDLLDRGRAVRHATVDLAAGGEAPDAFANQLG